MHIVQISEQKVVFIKSRPESNMGHVGSKTRSLGQFLEKPCVHSRGHNFDPIFMKRCQNVYLKKVLLQYLRYT